MININVFYNRQDQIVGFEVQGHAMGPDRVDQFDLVCCAVSVLTITTVNGITDYLHVPALELRVDNGWLKFLLSVNDDGTLAQDPSRVSQIDALLGSMVLGLEEIAQDYPKFIQLKKRR